MPEFQSTFDLDAWYRSHPSIQHGSGSGFILRDAEKHGFDRAFAECQEEIDRLGEECQEQNLKWNRAVDDLKNKSYECEALQAELKLRNVEIEKACVRINDLLDDRAKDQIEIVKLQRQLDEMGKHMAQSIEMREGK